MIVNEVEALALDYLASCAVCEKAFLFITAANPSLFLLKGVSMTSKLAECNS
jgi:hypothetical protein